jgi:hypothetical protein
MMVNGVEYNVVYDVNVEYATDKSAFNSIYGSANPYDGIRAPETDVSQNFVRIENENPEQKNSAKGKLKFGDLAGKVSFMRHGGNNGFWVLSDYGNPKDDPSVALHELAHGLKLSHIEVYLKGKNPGIMATDNMQSVSFPNLSEKNISTKTDDDGNKLILATSRIPYLEEFVQILINNGATVNTDANGVEVKNGIKDVEFVNGKATIELGKRTNDYYTVHGTKSKIEPENNMENE